MAATAPPRIFVSIASYRDPDCANTVRSLFRQAADPSRVFVGICLQRDPAADTDCGPLAERPEQCRVDEVHAADSGGACWARARTQGLWRGEDYVFQIDSHMRFVAGWDTALLEMLAACESPRAVLSTYPLRFDPPDGFQRDTYVTAAPKMFDSAGTLVQRPESARMGQAPAKPAPTPFLSAGMLFMPAAAMQEVPYDPHLYFIGEEISLAARLYTHGWDVFTPNRVVAYHDYTPRPARPRHWEDRADASRLTQRARARLRHLFGMEASDAPEVLAELDRYGLGTVRRLEDFEAFSGIDFRNRVLRAPYAGAPEEGPEGEKAGDHRRRTFADAWTQNQGPPARDATAVQARLPAVLDFLAARTLVDAGCGAEAWLDPVSARLDLYLGYDIVEAAVAARRARLAERRNHAVLQADIVCHDLPPADVLLCRDTLTRLPPDAVLAALRRFKAGGSRYLIATTHPGGTNRFIPAGGWQPLNLCARPFHLPAPLLWLDEQGSAPSASRPASRPAILGVWRAADLP